MHPFMPIKTFLRIYFLFFFSWHLFPARCFAVTLDRKKKKKWNTLYARTCTRITTNTGVFLVDTDRAVSWWVRSYRMPNFRAFIALWPFDSRLSPFSTVICFERVVEGKEPRSPFIALLSNRFEKSRYSVTKIMDYGFVEIFFSFLIVNKKERRVLVFFLDKKACLMMNWTRLGKIHFSSK